MRSHRLERQQWIPSPLTRVFPFFARAQNLSAITPPWLGFEILPPVPNRIERGTRIDYRIRLAGVPLRWRTRIDVWEEKVCFVDVQERGPYRRWEHLHVFEPRSGGVLMTDRVDYALPFGPLGALAHAAAVRAALAAIFDYRYQAVRTHFTEPPVSSSTRLAS